MHYSCSDRRDKLPEGCGCIIVVAIGDTSHPLTSFFLRVNFITDNEILKAHTVARS